MLINEFVKERDTALLSLDKEKILKYMKKYEIDLPDNELSFWAGIHKAILELNNATNEQKSNSMRWLKENGFNPWICR